jgi:hypothetical protein
MPTPKRLALAEIVAALGQLNLDEFPNAAAARAACDLMQAMADAPEIDRLQRVRERVEAELKAGTYRTGDPK